MPKLVLRPGTPQAQEFELKPGKNYVGRGFANDLKLDDASVSGSHALIEVTGNVVTIKDLGSTNGTRINQLPATQSPLQSGHMLRLGSVDLLFLGDVAAAQMPLAAPAINKEAAKIATEFVIREPSHVGVTSVVPPPEPPKPIVELKIPGSSPSIPPPPAPIVAAPPAPVPVAAKKPETIAAPVITLIPPESVPRAAELKIPGTPVESSIPPAPVPVPVAHSAQAPISFSAPKPVTESSGPAVAPVPPPPPVPVAPARIPSQAPVPVTAAPAPAPVFSQPPAPVPVNGSSEPKKSPAVTTEGLDSPHVFQRQTTTPPSAPITPPRPVPTPSTSVREPMISSAAELYPSPPVAVSTSRAEVPSAPTPVAAAKILAALQAAPAPTVPTVTPAKTPVAKPGSPSAEPPPGITACKFHQNNPGQWLCQKCNQLFCSLCVGAQPTSNGVGYFCRACGTQCVPVKVKFVGKQGKKLTVYSDATILLRILGFGMLATVVCGGLWIGLATVMGFPIPALFMVASGAACGYAIKLASQDRPGLMYTVSSLTFYFLAVAVGEVGSNLVVHMWALGLPTYAGFVGGIFLAWKIGGGDF